MDPAVQLSVVYAPLLSEIKQNVKNLDKVFTPDSLVVVLKWAVWLRCTCQLYLAFSLRKTSIDARESLSEGFHA